MKSNLIILLTCIASLLQAQEQSPKIASYFTNQFGTYGISEDGDTILIMENRMAPKKKNGDHAQTIQQVKPDKQKANLSPGDYMKKSGRYLLGGGLLFGTSGIMTGIGVTEGERALVYTSIGLSSVGIIIMFVGGFKMINAGHQFNRLEIGTARLDVDVGRVTLTF